MTEGSHPSFSGFRLCLVSPEFFPPFPPHSSSLDSNLGENLPRLILNQFRWLEHVVNPRALVALLIEVLEATSEPLLKKEVISAIPEIVSDSEHKSIVDYLQERMVTDSEVIVPTIDCLSNLSLKPNHLVRMPRFSSFISSLLPGKFSSLVSALLFLG